MKSSESAEVREVLAQVVRDQNARWTLRIEAAEALAAWASPESRTLTRTLFDELVTPNYALHT